MQLSFETMPKNKARLDLLESGAVKEMVDVGSRVCRVFALPKSIGQIFGLLYLTTEPLSLNQMSSLLGISKGSASTGTRQLVSWGAIRKVWIPGDRRDYFEVVEDLGCIIGAAFNNLIKIRIKSSSDRLIILKQKLKDDFKSGKVSSRNEKIMERRINSLEKTHKWILRILPIIEKRIK